MYPRCVILQNLRVTAFVHVPDESRRKLDPKAVECILVGDCVSSKSCRMWNPITSRIIISRDIVFKENAVYTDAPSVDEDN